MSVHVTCPSRSTIATVLSGSAVDFTHEYSGVTRDPSELERSLPAGEFDVDRRHFKLGTGRELYTRAAHALSEWRHFAIPWLTFHRQDGPVRAGQTVATLVRMGPLWFLNPCRVVYSELDGPPTDSAAFAYATLPGHAECGEERFSVSFDPRSGDVFYQLLAFSRPASPLVRLGYPCARRLQARFARASAKALGNAVA